MEPIFREIGGHLVQLPWDWVRRGSNSISTRVAEARGNFVSVDHPFVVKGRKWRIVDGVIKPVSLLLMFSFINTIVFFLKI